jgi:hypothetical protein
MSTQQRPPEGDAGGAAPPPEREPYVQRPPSPEEVKRISDEQALITDEWGGEGPEGAGAGRADRGSGAG